MVSHVYIGFTPSKGPTKEGIEGFRCVVEEAKRLGVKVAFENTEGEEYLFAVMDAFKDYDNVGFCWDTGHQMCYNVNTDMIELYGDRLICTHLNDNLGIKASDGNITFHDDLHMLPFDGIADWQGIADRLDRSDYKGELTFELKKDTALNGCQLPIYGQIGVEEYLTQAYIRACRVASLRKK